ncbi:SMI1/KNR4 family protein [Shewanella sairae]|uniref:SMI1/KNR4 family protein n=1 Tax=Shewanella sairae TaxID=190310 RepID=UPI00200D0B70|nr:SMI1/KNR4 family protein [Shewanella sairae]MCL1132590.1 SMI1/KNR4 family protein [Shewanella sairae]
MLELLSKLEHLIKANSNSAVFNEGASESELAELEEFLSLKLPFSYRQFLLKYNGGFICQYSNKAEPDWNEGSEAWNSHEFLGCIDIKEYYEENRKIQIKDCNWQGTWPYIPFFKTESQELLMFGPKRSGEIPVLDAFHELAPSEWNVLTKNFEVLLEEYVSKGGKIETVSS